MQKEPSQELDQRRRMILKAVVEAHIKSGEPVGSKLLAEMLPVTLSPATIRKLSFMGSFFMPVRRVRGMAG